METGIRGDRRADVDALYTEAQQALTQSANRLRALTERLRELHAEELATADAPAEPRSSGAREVGRDQQAMDAARAGQLLGRLELITRDLEDGWRFLERGQQGEWTSSGRGVRGRSAHRAAREPGGGPPRPGVAGTGADAAGRGAPRRTRPGTLQRRVPGPYRGAGAAVRPGPGGRRAEYPGRRCWSARPSGCGTSSASCGRRSRKRATWARCSRTPRSNCAPRRASGVDIDLAAPEELLDVPARTAVLRVALEALRNVRKHSGAERVRLSTRLEAGRATRPRLVESWRSRTTAAGSHSTRSPCRPGDAISACDSCANAPNSWAAGWRSYPRQQRAPLSA